MNKDISSQSGGASRSGKVWDHESNVDCVGADIVADGSRQTQGDRSVTTGPNQGTIKTGDEIHYHGFDISKWWFLVLIVVGLVFVGFIIRLLIQREGRGGDIQSPFSNVVTATSPPTGQTTPSPTFSPFHKQSRGNAPVTPRPVVSPTPEPPVTSPPIHGYKVTLILPSSMNQAEILVDGRSAIEFEPRQPIFAFILVKENGTPHQILIRKGERTCFANLLITEDRELSPCANQ